jgi:hypothetical protein
MGSEGNGLPVRDQLFLQAKGVTLRAVLFDLETDGLLPEVSTIWCICLRIIEDGAESPTYSYSNNPKTGEDDIDDAIGIIEEADMIIGQNILGYDLKVIDKLYEDFRPKEGQIVRDTQVMSQMYFANEKDKDFDRWRRGTLDGEHIGRHGLAAWGQRLGHYKGDYAKEMIAEGKDPWKDFDHVRGVPYCEDDVEVNSRLWRKIEAFDWSEEAIILEHQITELMSLQEEYGFWFNRKHCEEIVIELESAYDNLEADAISHFGKWWSPEKKYVGEPREDFGENSSRSMWAEVTIEKRETRKRTEKEGPLANIQQQFSQDAPYCKINYKEFNPGSRVQIIDRLKTIYEWEPVDFTEKGNPEVNDEVLRGLSEHWPICETLAELFFYSKLLGMMKDGKNGWLRMVDAGGFIHGRCNPGGTRSGRASHSSPNIAQVPKVVAVDVIDKMSGDFNPRILINGKPPAEAFKDDGSPKKSMILKGRPGDYGWECRSLFAAPKIDGHQWWLMGCDLKGVELRCFGHHLAEYDGGAYAEIVINGDVHTVNQNAAGLNSRDQAKTFIYATLYGAGDEKIGSIVCLPNTPIAQMKARGRELKAKFQEGLPAYRHLVKRIAKEARRGFLIGLDGRKLWVKSAHSALNLQLQSDGALLAKKWVCLFYQYMEEAGYVMGFNGDFVPGLWIHDEIQCPCRTKEIAEHAAELCKKAAEDSGKHFNYRVPIEADAKVGLTWAATH